MPRKKKAAPKYKRTPRVKSRKGQLGHVVYTDTNAKTTTVTSSKLNISPVLIPLLFLAGLTLIIFYTINANKNLLSFSSFSNSSQIGTQNNSQGNLPVVVSQKTLQLKENPEEQPQLTAKGIYAIDTKTNKVLFSKNENSPLLPASTTKMATALVGLQVFKPDDILTVQGRTFGQTMGLVVGEKITFDNLLHGLLIYSANDAAETIAANYPGGENLPAGRKGFIQAMNKLAEDNGLVKTHFTNPVGFDEYLHFSSAQDIAKLGSLGLQNPTFSQIVSTREYKAKNIDGTIIHPLLNTNQLLGKVEGVIGIKTGHTTTSGESLVTLVDRNGHRVLISVLGSTDRFGETTKLIDWIYNNYQWPSGQ